MTANLDALRAAIALLPELKNPANIQTNTFGTPYAIISTEARKTIIAALEQAASTDGGYVRGLEDALKRLNYCVDNFWNDDKRTENFETHAHAITRAQGMARTALTAPASKGPMEADVERVAKVAFDRQEFERHEDRPSHEPEKWSDIDETAKQYWREFVKPIISAMTEAG